ncbi:hypothetical protein ScPMuIL_012703 [Solemya velum]
MQTHSILKNTPELYNSEDFYKMDRADSFDDLTKSLIELCDDEQADKEAVPDETPVTPSCTSSICLSPIKNIDLSLWSSAVATSQKVAWSCSTPVLGTAFSFTKWDHSKGKFDKTSKMVKRSILPTHSTPLASDIMQDCKKRKCDDDIEYNSKNHKKIHKSKFSLEPNEASIDELIDEVSILCDDKTPVQSDDDIKTLENTLCDNTNGRNDSEEGSFITFDGYGAKTVIENVPEITGPCTDGDFQDQKFVTLDECSPHKTPVPLDRAAKRNIACTKGDTNIEGTIDSFVTFDRYYADTMMAEKTAIQNIVLGEQESHDQNFVTLDTCSLVTSKNTQSEHLECSNTKDENASKDHSFVRLDENYSKTVNNDTSNNKTFGKSTFRINERENEDGNFITLDECSVNILNNTSTINREIKRDAVNINENLSMINIHEVVAKVLAPNQSLRTSEDTMAANLSDPENGLNKTEGRFKNLDSTNLTSFSIVHEEEDLSDNEDILGLDELTYLDDSDGSEIDDTLLYEDNINDSIINLGPKDYKSILSENVKEPVFSDPAGILEEKYAVDFKRSEESDNTLENASKRSEGKDAVHLESGAKIQATMPHLVTEKTDGNSSIISTVLSEEDDKVNKSKTTVDIGGESQQNLKPNAESEHIQSVKTDISDVKTNVELTEIESSSNSREETDSEVSPPAITIVAPSICGGEDLKEYPNIPCIESSVTTLPSTTLHSKEENSLVLTAAHTTSSTNVSDRKTLFPEMTSTSEHADSKLISSQSSCPAAERKCVRNENNLMQIVMKKWGSKGIQSQDINLTCSLSYRKKHTNQPSVLEGEHISVLVDKQQKKQDTTTVYTPESSDMKLMSDTFLQELRNEFKLFFQKGEETIENMKNECMHQKYEKEQENAESLRNLSVMQRVELRHFRRQNAASHFYNPSLAQYQGMQLKYEHERQMATLREKCRENLRAVEAHFDQQISEADERLNQDRDNLHTIILQLVSEGSQKFDKLGPPISVNLWKAPSKLNPQKSSVAVCLPAKVASAIMTEDEIYDNFYKY